MNPRLLLLTLGALCAWVVTHAQAPRQATAAELHQDIKKLNVLGSVLYLAAHPDDENTRMIAYMANERHMNTAYLSLTRGDGGQNLIGKEIRELLGIIRTQELLAARRTDGGQQFFTRANDFGYSKTPDETLNIWEKDEVMQDIIWTIRKFQPDVIINRFSHDSGRATHGHHTTSAMLSYEAFDLAGDPAVYPEQLKHYDAWQPQRLFFNTSWWFYGSRDKFAAADKTNMYSVDVGVYYPLLGKSNNEIAAQSRSMHKCQGFGTALERGSQMEYLQLLKGTAPKEDVFEGINTTWTRVKGGAPIGQLVSRIDREFRADNPAASLPDLLKVRRMIAALDDGHWKRIKLQEVEKLIQGCLGLYLSATADDYSATPGDEVKLTLEAVNRLGAGVVLRQVTLPTGEVIAIGDTLHTNQQFYHTASFSIPFYGQFAGVPGWGSTNPYWLNNPATLGMYRVDDPLLRGLPETPRPTQVHVDLQIGGEDIRYTLPIQHKRADPVKGEVFRPFEVTPRAFVNIADEVYVFGNTAPKTVRVTVKAGRKELKGVVRLHSPKGWTVSPAAHNVWLPTKGEERTYEFMVTPPDTQSVADLTASVDVGTGIPAADQALHVIDYDHIPTQLVLLPSRARVVRVNLKRAGDRIGYIMGAGDAIPESLRQIGYEVSLLDDEDIDPTRLAAYDAVIVGIRAYNTEERMRFWQPKLLEYVKQGGTMIVQYNTSFRLQVDEVGPYPLELSRDRVSVEEAPVRILAPDHPVLQFPNVITEQDFEGWVQERGLYFPDKWDERYTPILSSNDPGEPARNGGLLVAPYGEGHFIYTGYSWFRELPAGVPGAFRLFANLISIGQGQP